MAEPTYTRCSARVILLDADDRTLLFRSYLHHTLDPALGFCWSTPGGGREEGESMAESAARELREETGIEVAPGDLGATVAYTAGYADLGFMAGHFRDDFFAHRVNESIVDTSGHDDVERSYITGHRWWTVDELATTDETVFPFGLVPLLRDLVAGRRPAVPVALPWHH